MLCIFSILLYPCYEKISKPLLAKTTYNPQKTMSNLLKIFQDSSALHGTNAAFIENLYEQFLADPTSIPSSWQTKFSTLQDSNLPQTSHSPIVNHFAKLAKSKQTHFAKLQNFNETSVKKQSAVARLINHYRVCGHQIATNNPLGKVCPIRSDFDPSYYGLSASDGQTVFDAESLYGFTKLSLQEIITALREIYCSNIGVEYMHIMDADTVLWIKDKLESSKRDDISYPEDKKISLLKFLTAAEGIEKHLHRKYVGQKRFSLEGSECLIPLLDELIQNFGERRVKEIVIGMAHRGRLNVLINILGKSPAELFGEFEGAHQYTNGALTGDVKYHMGFSSNIATPGGPLHLTLGFNPSHLEIINPVVEGSVKARQDRCSGSNIDTIVPILIHGDAAFAGQGIVMETLNMSETRAFATGGTVHIVINNQIGFTTSNRLDARSTLYCTDVAIMVRAPVFHVNGDDPEAVLFVTKLALEYRMKFNKDVVIDLICYRRLGHNEADEPAATQPLMYQTIRKLPTVRQIYAQKLVEQNTVSRQKVQQMVADYQQLLDQGLSVSRPVLSDSIYGYFGQWTKYEGCAWDVPCDTTVDLTSIRHYSDKLQQLPPDFKLHPRVAKVMENRVKMASGDLPIDWGYAENLAYASLVTQCKGIRLVGQDVGRGTFSHRHIALHNQTDGSVYYPIKHICATQGDAHIYDSLLSEAGVLGFEFGYSSTEPDKLVLWEAQFGDFANGAQVVIDQFISSAETKWGRLCGLVLLLPHGLEGQGPEHSSARLERYLQLCADHNIQVCCPTTPAQIFHLLRRQQLRPYRKPLVVMTPKSLLRHKLAVSNLDELSSGGFQCIIGEQDSIDPEKVSNIVICCGKVYYDLLDARRSDNLDNTAIIRIEQLYPFPVAMFREHISKYPKAKTLTWCQEEPQNQGVWYQSRHHFFDNTARNIELRYAGREGSAAPAVGIHSVHIEQQKAVIAAALYPTND